VEMTNNAAAPAMAAYKSGVFKNFIVKVRVL